MSTLWTQNSKLLISSESKLYLCDQCPCDSGPPTILFETCCQDGSSFVMEETVYLHIGDDTLQPTGWRGAREITLVYGALGGLPFHYGTVTIGLETISARLECGSSPFSTLNRVWNLTVQVDTLFPAPFFKYTGQEGYDPSFGDFLCTSRAVFPIGTIGYFYSQTSPPSPVEYSYGYTGSDLYFYIDLTPP